MEKATSPIDITEAEFDRFEDVRSGGAFNMITEARLAASEAKLSMDKYWQICKNYKDLAENLAWKKKENLSWRKN